MSALDGLDALFFDLLGFVGCKARWSRAVDGLGVSRRFIGVVVDGFGSPGCVGARERSDREPLSDFGSPGTGIGGARKRKALGFGACDGLGDECLFIGVGESDALSARFFVALLLSVSFMFARSFGSLGATFVEVRVGWERSWDVNVGAHDDCGLRFDFKRGGRGLLLFLVDDNKTGGGHGRGWNVAAGRAGAGAGAAG